jgi:hypothetical protein
MPAKHLSLRALLYMRGRKDRLSMHRVIVLAVFKIFFEPPTDFKPSVGGDGDVTQIEQPMNVGPEQQTVGDIVLTALTVRADMCGVENG